MADALPQSRPIAMVGPRDEVSPTRPVFGYLRVVRAMIGSALLVELLLLPRMWLENPYFGPISTVPWLDLWHAPIDTIVYYSLIGLGFAASFGRARWCLWWCGLFFLRTITDRVTWQPYLFELGLAFALIAWGELRSIRAATVERVDPSTSQAIEARTRLALQLLLGLVYIWAGLHKLNPRFVEQGPQWLLASFELSLPRDQAVLLAWLLPSLEAAAGLGLCFRKTQRLCAVGLIGMHIFLLAAIGPWARDYNDAVWPWNVVQMALLAALFLPRRVPTSVRPGWASLVVAVLLGFLPVTYYAHTWSPYLSMRLYTFNEYRADVHVSEEVLEEITASAEEVLQRRHSRRFPARVTLQRWANAELGIFLPPEPAVFTRVAARLCELGEGDDAVELILRPPASWAEADPPAVRMRCDELLGDE